MQQGFTKIVLIPAFEPTATLLGLITDLYDANFRIVLVDDGSSENYRWVFKSAMRFANVLIQDTNKGKGSALKTGLAYINGHCSKDSVIVTLDADGQHSVSDVQKVMDATFFSTQSMVLGCRCFNGDVPARSRFGNTVTRFIYRMTTGLRVSVSLGKKRRPQSNSG